MIRDNIGQILGKITGALVGVFDIAELQERVVQVSQYLFDAEACSLFLLDEERRVLRMTAARGYAERFIGCEAPFVPIDRLVEHPQTDDDKLGLTGWIASTGRSLMANSPAELQQHEHWRGLYDEQQFGPGKSVQNFYGVPLQTAPGETVGVLKVEGKREHGAFAPFTVQDAYVFDILAAHVAIAVANAQRVEHIKRQREQLETITNALHKVVGALSQESAMQSLLDQIVTTTMEVLHAEACVLFLRDEDSDWLVERAGAGYVKQLIGKARYHLIPREQMIEHPRRKKDRVGLTAWIAITGEPFLARNNKALRAHAHWRGQYDPDHYPRGSGKRCESFLGLPLRVGNDILGVLKVENKKVDGQYVPFTDQDGQVFETLARSIAIAIGAVKEQKIKLERRITDALYRVSQALVGRFELGPLLEEIVRTGKDIFDAEACVVFLVDEEDKNRLVETKGEGYVKQLEGKAEYALIPRDQLRDHPERDEDKVGLTAWIAITGVPFIAGNNEQLRAHPHWKGRYDPEHYPSGSGRRCESFLGLPLRIGEQVLGVLKVENKRSGGQYVPFDERDQQICQFLANGAAIAIQNARDLRGIQKARLLEAIGASAAGMAHGMGQYLQRIQGAADLLNKDLQRRGQLLPEDGKQIQLIREQVQMMDGEILRVKDAARPLNVQRRRSDIVRILRESFTEDAGFSKRIKERAIQARLSGVEQLQDPHLLVDAGLLSQAFAYLVDNALDAVPDGGSIEIRVVEADSYLLVDVTDTGPGIDEAQIPPDKLFEPFKTTKQRGLGLGLFLVRRNVEAHGGSVVYVRNQPHGACFRVTLPRHVRGEV